MKLVQTIILLFFTASAVLSAEENKTPALPALAEIFTVEVLRYSGNTFSPDFQFDRESFLATYPSLQPAKVEIPLGISFIWQNGVIVTKDKRVLFWRTCDKRFIFVDDSTGTFAYGVAERISLFDR
jgi:hypothetical protein